MKSKGPRFKINDRVTRTNFDESTTLHGQITETIGKENKRGITTWYYKIKWDNGSKMQDTTSQHRLSLESNART